MKKLLVILILMSMFAAVPFCGAQPAEETPADVITITGTVRHFTFGGGFYGIWADDDKTYKPIRLPMAFQRDGLRVTIKARVMEKKLLFHAWGTPIEVLDIRRARQQL